MRSSFTTAFAVVASLAVAAPLPAQVKQEDIKPKAAGTTSRMDTYNGKTLSQWIKQIKDRDPSLQEDAIRAVASFGPDAAKDADPALIDALSYQDTGVKVNAALALTVIGVDESHVDKAVPVLTRLLSDTQAIVRLHAAVALGRLDLDAKPAIPELVRAARDQYAWEIRRAAVYALGRAGRATRGTPTDMRAVGGLIYLFAGSYPERCAEVRLMAVMAVGSMGIPGNPADKQTIIQALNHATTDPYKAVAIWAHMAMMADGEPKDAHMKAILKYLNGSDFEAHLQATRALGTMGKEARDAIPELTSELKGKDPVLVAAACWALGEMGDVPDKVLQMIQVLMDSKDSDDGVKAAAKEALDKLTGKGKK